MRTTRRMLRASQPDKQNGTLSVHTIRASGHVHRSNRPNTRLHPTTTPEHQISPCNAGAIHTGHSNRQFRVENAGTLRPTSSDSYPLIGILSVPAASWPISLLTLQGY